MPLQTFCLAQKYVETHFYTSSIIKLLVERIRGGAKCRNGLTEMSVVYARKKIAGEASKMHSAGAFTN